ncbi:Uncharacterised protein [[Clostridium] sordellii]|uniref:hypothetical protein n=1 Tax=Paraclostridium sordellii TaxID=1505 RepID=UPI0005DFCC8A|nr:hypothetical protein [Paeniclostridium sordellii]CEP99111.1 Uncharacterised protein [[Clostridium] sordellii] [Paeniclostridium sordellii]
MKIRGDFVTNSSSTSFILMTDVELDLGTFLNKIGISQNSDMTFIFEHLYDAVNKNKMELDEYIQNYIDKDTNVFEYFRKNFSQEIAEKILFNKDKGKKIWIGKLSSDYDEYETFFCTDSFIIEGEEIYINGANCVW